MSPNFLSRIGLSSGPPAGELPPRLHRNRWIREDRQAAPHSVVHLRIGSIARMIAACRIELQEAREDFRRGFTVARPCQLLWQGGASQIQLGRFRDVSERSSRASISAWVPARPRPWV